MSEHYWNSFWKGLLAGVPYGIGIVTGITPTKEGISDFTAKSICESTGGLGTGWNCGVLFFLLMILGVAFTIWHLYTDISESHSQEKLIAFMAHLFGILLVILIIFIKLKP